MTTTKTIEKADLYAKIPFMLKKYPSIVAATPLLIEMDRSKPISAGSLMEKSAKKFKNKTALIYEDRRYT